MCLFWLWCSDDLLFGVADYVFFENSSSNPYLIRRIEELNKVLFVIFVPKGE